MQQDTAYSAVVVNDHNNVSLPISFFSCFYDHFWVKNDIRDVDTYDHSLQLHYRQYLVASFLLIYHPYPYEMIYLLVPLIFLDRAHQKCSHYIRTHAH